jgi:transglutaminase-like putative cysteine protease
MSFNTYFRASSYAMLATSALALFASGGLSLALAVLFAVLLVAAWKLEGTRWQVPERAGLVVVLLSLPLFYFDWRLNTGGEERVGVAALAHLILFLSSIKLLQKKADRDWVFLYLISFFEVLLAAGLSVSPLFLGTLGLYMLAAFSTVVAFEIKKAQRRVKASETRLLVAPDATLFRRLTKRRQSHHSLGEARRLPFVSFVLLVLIFAVALPVFFIAPRFGGSAFARAGGAGTRVSGFSETVKLGDIGRLQQSNEVVMRVRVENPSPNLSLRWRGIALDTFDGHRWSRSLVESQTISDRTLYQFEKPESVHNLTTQTFFLEPVDTPVLFAAPRVIAVQGALPYVRLDREGSVSTRPHPLDRITYKAISDTTEPDASALRADLAPYSATHARYMKVPETLDPRIARLAREWIAAAGARNRYDAARAIEQHLQRDFRYSLDMKAGGADPLADFLFNVREGHCEYFSTAMAVMLRTQGIAARVVNGFQRGEYNDSADVYTVTQKDAHSWVEVYFPETQAWVTFDPTPPDGRPVRETSGIVSRLGKYAEAMELYWNQYVIGYDRQEQRSLATSLRNQMLTIREVLSEVADSAKASVTEWLRSLQRSFRGGEGAGRSPWPLMIFVALLAAFLLLLVYRVRRFGLRRGLKVWRREREHPPVVKFYERMTRLLAARGLKRERDETPLEFALATRLPEVVNITRAYNRVRYGAQLLSASEVAEIEECLTRLEGEVKK